VLAEVLAAWNRADGAAYGKLFTDNADYIDITGTHTIGGDAIGRMHQFLFDGPLKGSQLDGSGWAQADIQFLAPTVALVIGGGASRLAGQRQGLSDRTSINTAVLVKQDGQWRIRAFQNNRVQPMPMPAPGSR
jgi:uncharacterized protein (TIGR02246 family)